MLPLRSRTFSARGRTFTHHFVDSPEVAVILPELPDGRIVLVRQYRAALDREILELPAGKLREGESAEAGARRELAEETGYRAGRLRYLFSFYPVPGYSTELIHAFHASRLAPGPTSFDEAEDLRNVPMTAAELEAAIAAGDVRDGKTLLTYLAWKSGLAAPFPDPPPRPPAGPGRAWVDG
ncbi:MAG: NUDIX hydrolase [Clostridia bacterium]|nr:NUDIX hydrolase [Clostridia bacterium]